VKESNLDTILVTSYAKAPQGTSMYEVYKHAGIVLEINRRTHEIVDADFTFIVDLTRDYFKRLVVGYDLSNGVEDLIEQIETHFWAPSTSSVVVALRAAYKRYLERIKIV
jgi:hypothetical protein